MLERPSRSASIEIPWPNNAPIDELERATPVGANVVVLAGRVKGAEDEARALEANGVSALDLVQPQLLTISGYGLFVEDTDGLAVAPRSEGGPLIVEGEEQLRNFATAVQAIRTSAARR